MNLSLIASVFISFFTYIFIFSSVKKWQDNVESIFAIRRAVLINPAKAWAKICLFEKEKTEQTLKYGVHCINRVLWRNKYLEWKNMCFIGRKQKKFPPRYYRIISACEIQMNHYLRISLKEIELNIFR